MAFNLTHQSLRVRLAPWSRLLPCPSPPAAPAAPPSPSGQRALAAVLLCLGLHAPSATGMGLRLGPLMPAGEQVDACAGTAQPDQAALRAQALAPLPVQAQARIPDSQAVLGQHDLGWVWLGSPTLRYPHRALGSPVHAASVHAQVKTAAGNWVLVQRVLPLNRVYEDRVPRIMDLDGDGSEEIVLIEADLLRGASLVVLGIEHGPRGPQLMERARGPFVGTSFRWLNPVGIADFDGDGRLDLASVVTPHIGGVLQLLHYRPPLLVPFAQALDVSNHRMGALEQDLAVVLQRPGQRPTIVLPDMSRRSLHALRWDAPGQWTELADPHALPGLVERLTPWHAGACALLADGRSLRINLLP